GPDDRRVGRPGAPAVPEPLPGQPGRGARRLREGAGPRDQPGAARAAAPRALPRGRDLVQPGPRLSLPGGRAGRDYPGCDHRCLTAWPTTAPPTPLTAPP